GFGERACKQIMEVTSRKTPIFPWDGEVFVSARVSQSPELAVRIETGSPVTFLRGHAARYLRQGILPNNPGDADGEIAAKLRRRVTGRVVGREKLVSAIDLDPSRQEAAHDDIATLGDDVLLQGRGVAIDFTRMELGTLDFETVTEPGSRPH